MGGQLSMILGAAGLIAGALLVIHYAKDVFYRRKHGYPPGPTGLPFVGSMISMGINTGKFFLDIGKESMVSLTYIFSKNMVLLNDPKVIHKLLNNKEYYSIVNDRHLHNPKFHKFEHLDIAGLDYKEWISRRKVWHTAMPKVLNNKKLDIIGNQLFVNILFPTIVKHTTDFSDSWKSIKVDFQYFQFCLLFQSIFGIVDTTKEEVNNRMKGYSDMMIEFGDKYLHLATLDLVFSWFLGKMVYNKLVDLYHVMEENFFTWIKENTRFTKNDILYENKDVGIEEPIFLLESFVDAKNNPAKYAVVDKKTGIEYTLDNYNWEAMFADIKIVFLGGLDTTCSTMEYTLIMLATELDLQNKIYNEINDYIIKYKNEYGVDLVTTNVISKDGSGNDITLKTLDFSKINFTQLSTFAAFIWESLRLSSIGAIGIPHYTAKELKFSVKKSDSKSEAFTIPKNSTIINNIVYANTQSDVWKNSKNGGKSDAFCLSHWLKYDDKLKRHKFVKNDNFVGFSVGRRNCLGYNFAVNTIYRVMITFIINYHIYGPNKPKNATDMVKDGSIPEVKFKFTYTRTIEPVIPISLEPRAL